MAAVSWLTFFLNSTTHDADHDGEAVESSWDKTATIPLVCRVGDAMMAPAPTLLSPRTRQRGGTRALILILGRSLEAVAVQHQRGQSDVEPREVDAEPGRRKLDRAEVSGRCGC